MKSKMIEDLQEILSKSSQEEFDKLWDEITAEEGYSPLMEEYLSACNQKKLNESSMFSPFMDKYWKLLYKVRTNTSYSFSQSHNFKTPEPKFGYEEQLSRFKTAA